MIRKVKDFLRSLRKPATLVEMPKMSRLMAAAVADTANARWTRR